MTRAIPIGSPGSIARRVHDALDRIDASLPRATDPGISYDNAYRRAAEIAALLAVETDPAAQRMLRHALERARNVGD